MNKLDWVNTFGESETITKEKVRFYLRDLVYYSKLPYYCGMIAMRYKAMPYIKREIAHATIEQYDEEIERVKAIIETTKQQYKIRLATKYLNSLYFQRGIKQQEKFAHLYVEE